jgi:hypothetical protein
MAQPKPQSFELTFAYRLLQALGGNTTNMYLILAIVAWVRRESGQKYIGNNPLNLRPGKDDAKWRSGIRQGRVGKFSVYANLTDAAKATANRLLTVGAFAGYKPIILAMRRAATTAADQQKQAVDVLHYIAMSKWSSDHYGYGKTPDPNMSETDMWAKNKIIALWQSLTNEWGSKVTLPKDAPIQPKPNAPVPKQPRSLAHTIPTRDYLLGFQAYTFYVSRHEEVPTLPGIEMEPGW